MDAPSSPALRCLDVCLDFYGDNTSPGLSGMLRAEGQGCWFVLSLGSFGVAAKVSDTLDVIFYQQELFGEILTGIGNR
ncbi:hypothetical protein TNCT_459021 [Trichonephila clavata]|uniref:Uncharacterized protein n=1 Tax=Trichonephila clavata TaxID=2740835 RepID=A0A8X6J467_TRICU|nr:hypothetical protein TNCT_459021 [Trichonephila clavata]